MELYRRYLVLCCLFCAHLLHVLPLCHRCIHTYAAYICRWVDLYTCVCVCVCVCVYILCACLYIGIPAVHRWAWQVVTVNGVYFTFSHSSLPPPNTRDNLLGVRSRLSPRVKRTHVHKNISTYIYLDIVIILQQFLCIYFDDPIIIISVIDTIGRSTATLQAIKSNFASKYKGHSSMDCRIR